MRNHTRRATRRHLQLVGAGVLALSLVAAACGDDDDASDATDAPAASDAPAGTDAATATTEATSDTEAPGDTGGAEPVDCETTDSVKLQLQWVAQAQFAGYYAAEDQGYFADQCLEVELIESPPDVVPQQLLADGQVDFAIAWVPKALATREAGADIVNIAQIFQRSGTLQVSFADAGITTPADFAGKNIGNWGFGNEYEVFAALGEAGLDPATDVNLVGQDFNMNGLLSGDIDAAEAMTYNEYAQILEA